jgi:homoserine kinase
MAAGALGFSISGAGPSVFGLCEGEESAKRVGEAIAGVFSKGGLENQLYVSRVNQTGVKVIG